MSQVSIKSLTSSTARIQHQVAASATALFAIAQTSAGVQAKTAELATGPLHLLTETAIASIGLPATAGVIVGAGFLASGWVALSAGLVLQVVAKARQSR